MTARPETAVASAVPRSAFVTAVGWIFIVLAGFSTAIALLQNVMIHLFFPPLEMQRAADEFRNAPHMPWAAAFMFEHMRALFGLFLALSVLTLAAAIGLVLRRNWARITFIAVLVLGIVWNLAGLVFMFAFFDAMPGIPDHATSDFASHFNAMMWTMVAFNAVWTLLFSGLFAWIIKRLVSPAIRAEFSRP